MNQCRFNHFVQRHFILSFLLLVLSQVSFGQDLPANLRRSAAEVLGTIDPAESDDCIVRAFADPYPSLIGAEKSREFRWRIRVPNGSNFNLLLAHGSLPNEGFPKSGIKMIRKNNPLPATVGDIVIVLRAKGEPNASLELSIFGEFPQNLPFGLRDPEGKEVTVIPNRENASYYDSLLVREADWIPYWKDVKPKLENLSREKETRLKPEGQHWLMKHFTEVDVQQDGFAVWFEFAE